ncbi:Mu transposase domain-containing protein [Streptomyces sp. NPDC016845]|uniref:Mu transposase domain-containing protein n=1 Tax=Streptomyces sp. NPDC016845 TaxID=3364972 RepID=UPI0037B36FC5
MEHPHLQPWQRTVTTPLPTCPKNKARASRSSVNTPEVASLAELNELVDRWDLQDEDRRLRSRSRTIGESFAHEQPLLRPLPTEVFETGRWFTPRVNRFGQITVRSNTYSVPVHFIGRQLRVLLHANDLVVYEGRTEVARHERLSGRGGSRLVLDHYLQALLRKPGAFPGSTPLEQARSAGRFTPVHDRWWAAACAAHGDAAGTRALIADAVALEARKAAEGDTGDLPTPAPATAQAEGPAATVTSLTDWRLSHLPPDNRPLPSVAHYDQLLNRRGRRAGNEKEGS